MNGGTSEPRGSGQKIPPAAGDDAAAGTPGTGENTCPACGGSGRVGGSKCPDCGGTGMIVEGIGGG